jgi:hypothetical protein
LSLQEKLNKYEQILTAPPTATTLPVVEKAPSTEGHMSGRSEMEVGLDASCSGNCHEKTEKNVSAQAQDLYAAGLPELLRSHRGKWVAFSSEGQIAIDADPNVVYRLCSEQGYRPGEFLMSCIEPEAVTDLVF